MEPRISLILPAYNCAKTIRDTIESILSQTFKEWELIIVDDGSNDTTGMICNGYAETDSRIRVVHKVNEGVSIARDIGIKMARGEFIEFIDSDDLLMPHALEKVLSNIEGVGLLIFGYEMIPGKIIQSIDIVRKYECYSQLALDYPHLAKQHLINCPWNKLYRREIIGQFSIEFPKDISMGEDLLFNLSYFKVCGSIKVIPDALYQYRNENSNSLSKKVRSNSFEIQKHLKQQVDELFGEAQEARQYSDCEFANIIIGEIKGLVYCPDYEKKYKIEKLEKWLDDPVFQSCFKSAIKDINVCKYYARLVQSKKAEEIYNIVRIRFHLSSIKHIFK